MSTTFLAKTFVFYKFFWCSCIKSALERIEFIGRDVYEENALENLCILDRDL